MPRQLRIEYPGAIYHVMNRGDGREAIFRDDEDRARFLATLGEACGKTEWQVRAYCLMPNHFHLVVETPQGNLVAGRKGLLGSEEFREALLAGEADAVGANQYGTERFETGQEQAGRLMAQELKHRGWNEKELQRWRKGEKEKVKLAAKIRAETTMTLAWIAQHRHRGSWGYVSNLLKGK